mmetsp:Transcript_35458/g.97938  ORF Transcript_35458/g.97938 Transcript_35458/m.97938 type:complete len:453 (+) Transcript_35458:53-1411(+)
MHPSPSVESARNARPSGRSGTFFFVAAPKATNGDGAVTAKVAKGDGFATGATYPGSWLWPRGPTMQSSPESSSSDVWGCFWLYPFAAFRRNAGAFGPEALPPGLRRKARASPESSSKPRVDFPQCEPGGLRRDVGFLEPEWPIPGIRRKAEGLAALDAVFHDGLCACSTSWTTPTATVVFESRTAKRPSGGYSLKGSTHIGACGRSRTTAASPARRVAGSISRICPVRRSVLDSNFSNRQGTWAVWHSTQRMQPEPISPPLGRLSTMTCAKNVQQSQAGLSSATEPTMPRPRSFIATSTATFTVSPQTASFSCSWCISSARASVRTSPGTKTSCMPGRIVPVATRPTATTPAPPICITSCRGSLSGLSGLKCTATASSKASNSVGPQYQGMLAERKSTLSPIKPDVGTKCTSCGFSPTFLRSSRTTAQARSKCSSKYPTASLSILFTQTTIW